MNWIVSNWVDRRAARERHLKNAAEVWRKAQGALADACASLNQHYADIGRIERTSQGAHLVIVTIRPATSDPNRDEMTMTKVLRIRFDPDKPKIAVIEDRKRQDFPIDADCDHAFVTLEGRELLLDEFSRHALETTFFSFSKPRQVHTTLTIVGKSAF
jgi:hypothetical protein